MGEAPRIDGMQAVSLLSELPHPHFLRRYKIDALRLDCFGRFRHNLHTLFEGR